MELVHILIAFVVGLLGLIYAYFKYSFTYWQSKGVEFVEPIFPYGSIKGFATKYHSSEFMQIIYNKFNASTRFVGLYIFARPAILIHDLELIKHVLIKDFEHFTDRGMYYNKGEDPLSAHLFAIDGPEWRILRPKLTSTFTSGKMKFMFPTVVEIGDRLRECLFNIVQQNDELEIKDILARYTTDVIGTCAFGIECNSLADPNAEFREKGLATFEKPRHGQFIGLLKNNFGDLARRLHIKHFADDVTEFFLKVVFDTVEYREKNNVQRNDFMDLLIKMKNDDVVERKLTMEEIAAQAFVFFLAGFETSSTTLAYCLYELAMNKNVQDKARDEIRNAFKLHNGQFTYEMMADMPYVDHVLQETLRMYPPVANLTRVVRKNYTIPGTNVELEKGTMTIIPAFAIQRDPDIYPNPETFDPDRFDTETVKQRNSMAWLPFGEGPRNCIGLRFGMIQARVGLVNILNNFEISLSSKTSDTAFTPKLFILTAVGGIYLRLKNISSN